MVRVVLIHGNGNSSPSDHWLPYIKQELENLGLKVDAPQFPDTKLARSSFWLPFIERDLQVDHDTIIIGHSSGAIAAMRYAETHQILGSVLVGAYCTDLNIENEQLSGYFNSPWDWKSIRKNQKWIVQFADSNDPWIPIKEAHQVRDFLGTEYYESSHQDHFCRNSFPELLAVIRNKIV